MEDQWVTCIFFFKLVCIFQIFCNKHLGIGQSVSFFRNGKSFFKDSYISSNKSQKNGIQHRKGYRNIINYPSSFCSLKFNLENQRQSMSSQEKKSSLTSYCLTIKNNLTEHWYIQVSCVPSITQHYII